MKIIVIGGTGLIGSKVVTKLQKSGFEAVAASPNSGVNTITGEGLAEALTDASVVVDIVHATQFFEFIHSIADSASDGTTVRVPPVLIQPIAAD